MGTGVPDTRSDAVRQVVKDDTPKPIPDRETQVPPPPPIIEPDAETDPASDTAETERRPQDDRKPIDEVAGAGTPWLVVAGVSAVVLPALVFTAILGSILMLKRRRRNRRLRAARRLPTNGERMARARRLRSRHRTSRAVVHDPT